MRDEVTLPRFLTKQEVLALVPVTFPKSLGLDQKIPVPSPAHNRQSPDVARERSCCLDQLETDANVQTLKSGDIKC